MKEPLVIELGAGHAARWGIGNKAALLDRARRRGLPVPDGIMVTHAAWQTATGAGHIVETAGASPRVEDSDALMEMLRLPTWGKPVAVRSAFSAEDTERTSLAGYFATKLHVDDSDPTALTRALAEVWASASVHPGCFRRDLLVQEMVDACHAGVAFTERAFEDDLVNYTAGNGAPLVAGAVSGHALHLPKLRAWEDHHPVSIYDAQTVQPARLSTDVAACMARVQHLLREVRRVFGAGDWDVEWADDGAICWLLQVRPVTRRTRRNEIFTNANNKEILPELPSTFMSSLIESCGAELSAFFGRFDPELPTSRPFCELFYGRPYINLSLLTDMMRILGLPTGIVTYNIGGDSVMELERYGPRWRRKLPVLWRLFRIQVGTTHRTRRIIEAIHARTLHPGESFTDCVASLRWLYITTVIGMFTLIIAMGAKLGRLRRIGVLPEHSARHHTITTEMYTELEPLRRQVHESDALRRSLQRGQVPDDPAFRMLWDAYLAKHGHRGIYESDIARLRLCEDPAPMLASLLQPVRQPPTPPRRTLVGRLTFPLWWRARRAMDARERLRYESMKGMARIRAALLALAERSVTNGQLPHTDALWDLTVGEVQRLEDGWRPDAAFWTQRRREIDDNRRHCPPDLLHRFAPLAPGLDGGEPPDASDPLRWSGVSLTPGTVEGRAWVLMEPSGTLPPGFDPAETILVARSVDAGWVPTFAAVAGVVVEIGGDLSHGSIILREIGLPAITNVRHVTRRVRTGDWLHLHADRGVVGHRSPTDAADRAL